MLESRGHLLTEQINPNSQNLDRLTSLELVDLFNQEDRKNLQAIAAARSELAKAIDLTAASLSRGGRLFYVGAGTSGRLGVLDAAECPPTFCTPPELVQGILAGGAPALLKSSEALEDRREDGAQEIAQKEVTAVDVVLGITAGGTTPFVHGAIAEAKKRGATTIFLACVPASQFKIDVDVDLRLLVGPEILAGSTRLKAGTVTKMALNILSTSVMVKLGKTYGNRMIDVSVTNQKLRDRALRILQDLADLDRQEAETLLDRSGQKVKLALLMHWGGVSLEKGNQCLEEARGNLRTALELANR
ncbi:N-acetylmuramic acid 6-phosphate etherase [Spirulina sp. 06S082]|uniref:N-acetylmuramic acid 6-phosphate etherase n=1 Tax=Spirulina sp. 06S082 TaxID=3110248 RepID=UPI003A4E46E3